MQNKKGFTLVELIVVISILAILGTIGFISLQGYSSESRDSKRVSDLLQIRTGLQIEKARKGIVPMPENAISIGTGSTVLLYQGYAGTGTLNQLRVSEAKDPVEDVYYTYTTNYNRTKFQLVAMLENEEISYNTNNIITKTYSDYENRIPFIIGYPLGILFDSTTNTPIQELSFQDNEIDLSEGEEYTLVTTREDTVTSSGAELVAKIEEETSGGSSSNTNSRQNINPKDLTFDYNFTNCGSEGAFGPGQSVNDWDSDQGTVGNCGTEYLGTSLEGNVNVNNGIQMWEVPESGNYGILAQGAGLANYDSNKGAEIYGEFYFEKGEILKILVGQKAARSDAGNGGSFVSKLNNDPIIVAGGAGGYNSGYSGEPVEYIGGQVQNINPYDDLVSTEGNAGKSAYWNNCGGKSGGGGYYQGSQHCSWTDQVAHAFVDGGEGGHRCASGGFGGGGGGCYTSEAAGGGGYTGGSANQNTSETGYGGGSYNSGNNIWSSAASHEGHGRIKLKYFGE